MRFKLTKSRFECTVDVVAINDRGEDADIVEISARQYGDDPIVIEKILFRNKRYLDDPLADWINREAAENFVGKKGIAAGIRNIEFQVKRRNSTIMEGKSNPLYEPMKEIVEKFVQHFESDFTVRDCEALGNGADHFLWLVHDSGTWNFPEQCDWGDKIIQDAEMDPNIIPYLVKDGKVTRIDQKDIRTVYLMLTDHRLQEVPA